MKVIKGVSRKIRSRGDISDETLDYFLVNNPRLGRFYLLPKIHKRLHNVTGRPVISNSSYFAENISSFLNFEKDSKSSSFARWPYFMYSRCSGSLSKYTS